MNIITRVVRRVKLDDPIDLGDIEASGRDIGAEKST
jgi:hypothetical protein